MPVSMIWRRRAETIFRLFSSIFHRRIPAPRLFYRHDAGHAEVSIVAIIDGRRDVMAALDDPSDAEKTKFASIY